jgi:hypothetical protein
MPCSDLFRQFSWSLLLLLAQHQRRAFLILWTGVVAISHSSFSRSLFLLPTQHQRREAFLVLRTGVLVISKSTFQFLSRNLLLASSPTPEMPGISCAFGVLDASVIEVGSMFRTCQLAPRFGRRANRAWTSNNVLDRCEHFLINNFISSRDHDH